MDVNEPRGMFSKTPAKRSSVRELATTDEADCFPSSEYLRVAFGANAFAFIWCVFFYGGAPWVIQSLIN
jgi:hypothetical protein